MFRWLIRIALAALALRLLAGTRRRATPATRPSFAPDGVDLRAKSRAPEPFSPHEIEDADFDEIPGGGR